MKRKFTRSSNTKIPDPTIEGVRQTIDQRLDELQGAMPEFRILRRIVLPNGTGIQIAHGLGRPPLGYFIGPPAGSATSGRIEDWLGTTTAGVPSDMSRFLSLRAVGYGAAITVDILVM